MISYNKINNVRKLERCAECITIGRLAPDFMALSTSGYVRLSDYRGKWVILVSSPSAFGDVATSEIINAAEYYDELLERNAYIIGLTTDNVYANLAWIYDIYQTTGVAIPFPIIADADLAVSELYGMLNPDRLYSETVRDTFIIDPTGRIRAIIALPVSTGRDFEELVRVFDSIQIKENYNLNTPSGWRPGDPYLVPNAASYEEIINRMNNKEALGYYCPTWYLCYTNLDAESGNNAAPPQVNNNVAQPPVNNINS